MPKIKLKNLKKNWGEFDFETGQITIHAQLKKVPRPSKKATKYHEEYHKFLADQGIKELNESIELKCEVWSLMCCKKSEITYLERYLKKNIIAKFGKLNKEQILKMNKFI